MIERDWYGFYSESWKDEIVPEAFAHPAKFSRGLIRKIYEYMFEQGWLKPGDVVLDPFGGVGLGGVDAALFGLYWIGIELEEKFVTLGQENISLWLSKYGPGNAVLDNLRERGRLPEYGSVTLLQGDSRQLVSILSTASGVVSSPPYSGSLRTPDEGDDKVREKFPEWHGSGKAGYQRKYSDNKDNLGNLPPGNLDASVSSPPWEETGEGVRDMTYKGNPQTGHYKEGQKIKGGGEYGSSDGQLGTESGDTFWAAARQIVEQTYQVLKPGAVAVWVLKSFVRDKKRVDFPDQWRQLGEACGFETIEWIRAWLVEDRGTQYDLWGEPQEKTIERKSFFRRLAESKGSPRIDFEIVLIQRKPGEKCQE